MADLLDVEDFVARSRSEPVIDVRTPAEFADGHVPDAINLPLFSNAERATIGTTYSDSGRRAAMLEALDLVGPKMRSLVESAMQAADGDDLLMHCWRGGMRSESVGWLLSFFGYRVRRLRGGYKAFRRFARGSFARERPVRILGGLTGSGKTDVLHALHARGEQIIDLEGLARHRGSVFGGLGRGDQPTQQQFENDLALQLHALDPKRPVWIEDESRRIGDIGIPDALFDQMQTAPTLVLDVPDTARLDRLVDLYGAFESGELHDALDYIRKRLGGLRTQQAHAAISTGHLRRACRIILNYYDDAYQHGLEQRPDDVVDVLSVDTSDSDVIASQVLDRAPSPT
jgi:tRNA 2-selenouridine synthase